MPFKGPWANFGRGLEFWPGYVIAHYKGLVSIYHLIRLNNNNNLDLYFNVAHLTTSQLRHENILSKSIMMILKIRT